MICVSLDTTLGRCVPARVHLSDIHPQEEVRDGGQLKIPNLVSEDCAKNCVVLITSVLGFCHHPKLLGCLEEKRLTLGSGDAARCEVQGSAVYLQPRMPAGCEQLL